jgi:hypothetical protein
MIDLGNNTVTNRFAIEEALNEAASSGGTSTLSYKVYACNITNDIIVTGDADPPQSKITQTLLQNDFVSDNEPEWGWVETGVFKLNIPGADFSLANTMIFISINNVGEAVSSNRPPYCAAYVYSKDIIYFRWYKGDNAYESEPDLNNQCSIEIRQYN